MKNTANLTDTYHEAKSKGVNPYEAMQISLMQSGMSADDAITEILVWVTMGGDRG